MAAVLTKIADLASIAPFVIRAERPSDIAAREALLDASFGESRHARTCQRLRDGRVPADDLAFTATHGGRLVGTVRLWNVSAGGIPALVLGPLAVDASCRKLGVGAALMNRALDVAQVRGHGAVILLGDAPYYSRFGFSELRTGSLSLPGPFDRDRLLAIELRAGTLEGASGVIVPTGAAWENHGRKKQQADAARGLNNLWQIVAASEPVRVRNLVRGPPALTSARIALPLCHDVERLQ